MHPNVQPQQKIKLTRKERWGLIAACLTAPAAGALVAGLVCSGFRLRHALWFWMISDWLVTVVCTFILGLPLLVHRLSTNRGSFRALLTIGLLVPLGIQILLFWWVAFATSRSSDDSLLLFLVFPPLTGLVNALVLALAAHRIVQIRLRYVRVPL